MDIEAIYQNAEVVSQSVNGEINRVVITYDEYDFLTETAEIENHYKGNGDDFIEMDYHSEFIPLIRMARSNVAS